MSQEGRQQTSWDWRAAGNFILGGAGGGLIVCAALAETAGVVAPIRFLCGAVLVAAGLFCVWLEIGRPLRALNVFRQPRRSWMSREAIVATLLIPCAAAAALGVPGAAAAAALLAVAFVYCQARIVRAARGIPAWRLPEATTLVFTTGLAEGIGIVLATAPPHGGVTAALLLLAGVLSLVRWGAWLAYRRALAASGAPRALAVLDRAALPLQWAGTLVPLALLALALAFALATGGALDDALPAGALVLAGAGMVATGAWLKFVLVTRAAFHQAHAIAVLPVRGVRVRRANRELGS